MTFADSEPTRFFFASYSDGTVLKSVRIPEYAQLVFTSPSDLLVVISRKLGSQPAGMYVNRGTRWLFVLPYQDIGIAFGGDYSACVYVNPKEVVSFGAQSLVYRNGYQAVLPAILPGVEAAWLVLTPKSTSSTAIQTPTYSESTAKISSFEYQQSVADSMWVVDHTLNKYPSVTVIDSAGDEIEGEVRYASKSRVVITFSSPLGGRVFLN